jgi:histidinol-phosphatase
MTGSGSHESLLQAVHECAELAGAVALSHYRRTLAVEWKGDGSPVTVADRGAEEAARAWVRARFPADGLLGEEFGEAPGSSGRRWVIDPIDGTKAFVRGVPLWGSLVAVVEGERVLAGAASFPAVGETIAAALGCGSWHDGARARVSAIADLRAATVLVTDDRVFTSPAWRDGWARLAAPAAVCRTWGDAFGYLMVATGRAEVMVDPVANPWDIACFQPVIEEAGGLFTSLDGAATAFGGHSIATNAALAAESRRILCSA